ncbi:MAG: 5'-methylthioadenosine/S-adenosylhomocysteine nucleosidase [Eubacterium sp.]|nr:5'-methylthioadenosine/S-adenosylhomocysteine nucleosidase [Eubacterium sp.]
MKIGIIIAIERELQAFLENGSEITEEQVGGNTIYHTKMEGHDISAILSGYGEIDAAAATQILILQSGCDIILNFGVTGALVPGMKVKDLFVVRRVCHYEYDVSPIDPVKEHQYEEFPDEYIPLDDSLLAKAEEILPEIKEVTVASGGRFIEKKEDKDYLASLGCQICDMEIAAISRICWKNNVKCLSIKCISDTYEGDGGDFNENVISSAKAAFDVIKKLIRGL